MTNSFYCFCRFFQQSKNSESHLKFLIKKIYNRRKLFFYCLLILFSVSINANADAVNDSTLIVDRIIITGNNKTKPRIITRELIFQEGDTLTKTILDSAILKSKENLMNIGLFNFVDVHIYQAYQHHADINIDVTERWYIFPFPVFDIADRNFNEWWSKRDLNRVNYGLRVSQENFRGRDEILQFQLIFGYSQRLGIYYTIPYINRKQNIGLTMALYGTRNHEIAYDSQDDKLVFYKNPDHFIRSDLQGYVRITKRKGIYNYFNTTFDFRTTRIADTVRYLNEDYFTDKSQIQNHFGLSWGYVFDKRDYRSYAMNGIYFELGVSKTGLGLLNNEPNLLEIYAGIRKYQPITKRFNIEGSVKGRLAQKNDSPYFDQRALGYGADYIRGYDYYVINGQNLFLSKSNLRYTLMKTHVYELPVINSNKFRKVPVSMYLNTFFDSGYVQDHQFGYKNPLTNSWQYGYGLGFDLVTYYDLVFRFEIARNRLNENGFFFHIGTAI